MDWLAQNWVWVRDDIYELGSLQVLERPQTGR